MKVKARVAFREDIESNGDQDLNKDLEVSNSRSKI